MSDLFVIVGLGNPGPKYAETRHNAGFWFLDFLCRKGGVSFRSQSKLHAETARISLHGQDCLLVRPTTSMNLSGRAVRAVKDYYQVPVSKIFVAYDELDLPVGVCRLKQGGGHGGHNGIRDIYQHLPEREFLRLRIGIGHPGNKNAVTAYVLSRPAASDEQLIWHGIEASSAVLPDIMDGHWESAMKILHTKDDNELNN